MEGAIHIRRLAGFGWEIESGRGEPLALKRDDGTVTRIASRLVGTREAAELLGVRPPNFVRDWASRADFPAPVATLSSGRVWSAPEVEQYAETRRAAGPGEARIREIAGRTVWWQSPDRTLARPREFVARVMASGSLDDIRDVERAFGRRLLCEAVLHAPAGIFDRRAWNYWLFILGLDRSTPLPARLVP
jgi:predicted DNA-binding transcriptional regulator AlpA